MSDDEEMNQLGRLEQTQIPNVARVGKVISLKNVGAAHAHTNAKSPRERGESPGGPLAPGFPTRDAQPSPGLTDTPRSAHSVNSLSTDNNGVQDISSVSAGCTIPTPPLAVAPQDV